MLKFLFPSILVVASGVIFFWFIDPLYGEIQTLRQEESLFNEALNNSRELQAIRDDLLTKYNSLSSEELDRLEKLVPENIDNVRLVRDLDGIASKYGMAVRDVDVRVEEEKLSALGLSTKSFGTVFMTFSVTAPYKTFLNFMSDLEKSLRIIDVVDVSFAASDQDFYEYRVIFKTYWLQ